MVNARPFGCQIPLEHQVLFIGQPKLNLATMLDDSTLILEGVIFDLGWIAIFRSLIDMMDGSLHIAFVFRSISIHMYGCVVYLWMDNDNDEDLDMC